MATDPSGTIAVDQPVSAGATPSLRLLSVDARATPQDFGSGIAQGLDSVSKGLGDFSTQLEDVSNKRDALYAQQVATKAEVDWRQNLSQAETAFTLDPSKGVNYADTYKTQFNDYQQQVLANNPDLTPNAKNQVMARLNNVGATMFDDALRLQAKASTDWSVQSFQNTSKNLDDLVNGQNAWVGYKADGTLDTSFFDNLRDQHTEMVKNAGGLVPDGARREELLRFNTGIDKAEIDTVTSRFGAGVAAKGISDGSLGTSLSIPQRQSQILELNRRQTEDSTEDIRKFVEMSKGYQYQIQATGQKDPTIEANIKGQASTAFGSFGPAYAAKALRSASTDQDQFDAQKQLDTFLDTKQKILDSRYPTPDSKANFIKNLQDPNHESTPQELDDQFYLNYMPSIREKENPVDALAAVQQHIQEFNEQVKGASQVAQATSQIKSMTMDSLKATSDGLGDRDDTLAKNLRPIVSQRIKAINDDPYSVTVQDDKQMQNLLSQANAVSTGKNALATSLIGESGNDRANSITQQVIARSLSLQQTLNPTSDRPMVMGKPEADDWIGKFNGAKNSTEFNSLASSFQNKFGNDYYQMAINQLHNNKNNPLPAGMSLALSNVGDPNAKDIATAVSIPDGKGTGSEKEKDENPGYAKLFANVGHPDDEKAIDTAISTDPLLSKYRDTNAAVSNSRETMDATNNTINAVGKYAKFLYLNPPAGQSYTPQQAVDAAVQSSVGKHVDFGNTNGVNYMINRESDKGRYTDEETGKIKDQLNEELKDIAGKQGTVGFKVQNTPDYTDQYNTKLNPDEESKFQDWKQKYAPNDSGFDYDLRGAFKAGVVPDGERGHFPDTFKKPNHPTFSDQSQYSTTETQGGKWGNDNSFTPSEQNLKTYGVDGLKQYFSKVEPNSKLNIEDDISNPGAVSQASLFDLSSKAYWITKSDLTGVSLMMPPVEGESASRAAIPVPNSYRSFQDMLNKANAPKPKEDNSTPKNSFNIGGI